MPRKTWRREFLARLAVAAAVVFLMSAAWGPAGPCQAAPAAPAAQPAPAMAVPPPKRGPTFAQIYANYRPDFLETGRISKNDPHKLSLQPWFYNMAQMEQDYRVEALIKKADELFAATDWRGAMKLYQAVIDEFPNDLWRIQPNGIFIPSGAYCQRQLLRMPTEQVFYYRTLHDAEARTILERARKYYSLLDLAEVAERYLATSYGDDALWELGNAFLDQGRWAKALYYYRQIMDYCVASDVPADQLALRMATCCRRLGLDKEYRAARERYANALKGKPATAFLAALDRVKVAEPAYFRQVRKEEYPSMGDYDLAPDLSEPIYRKEFVWSEPLPGGRRGWHVRALPWVAGNYLYYLHDNMLFCRSALTGKLNWQFSPGGRIDWFDVAGNMGGRYIFYTPESDVLIHDGLVFAPIVKEGPSLVAVDRITGQLKWARGPITTVEEERGMRYLAPPVPGPNVVYTGYVYDDIEGKSHLTSKVGVQCLDSRTGRLVWQREVCLLTPPKFSTSRRVRRIRIYGTQPTVANGVVYFNTNAGVIAALDALSGTILWATRYPQDVNFHDLLRAHSYVWFSRPPLLYEGRLYVTPDDCDSAYSTGNSRLICLDAATGKVLWSRFTGSGEVLMGINRAGELVTAGVTFQGMDPKTGKTIWNRGETPADVNRPLSGGRLLARPIMTRSGKLYFCTMSFRAYVMSEQYWDMVAKKTVGQRWYYYPGQYGSLQVYNGRILEAAAKKGEEPDPAKLLANNTDPFSNYERWSFERYGTTFEVEISPQRFSVWYDRKKVASAAGRDQSPAGLFSQAELVEMAGDRRKAIELLNTALSQLPGWPTPLRTEINRQLFRMYNREAEAAMRSADFKAAETCCYQMAAACTTSDDEIHTILAMAEVFGKQGRWSDSAACLSAAIRHYQDVKIHLPALLTGDATALKATGQALLANLQHNAEQQYYAGEFDMALKAAQLVLPDYFSVLTPLPAEAEMQTGQFATHWLQRLAASGSDGFRQQREAEAEKALSAETDQAVLLKLMAEYPATAAAQHALDRLIDKARGLPEPDRRIQLWRLNDAGRLNGLKVPAEVQAACNIVVKTATPEPLAGGYRKDTTTLDYDANTLLVALAPAGERAVNSPVGFVGMRSRRRYANKFGLLCWDLTTNKKRWQATEIRLRDKGEEEGFTKFYLHDDNVIVHGWYDVLAFSLADGKLAWRFSVPHGFRIIDSGLAEDLLVLTDNTRTIAVHLAGGRLVWEANETGGVYSPPYLRDNVLITVRRNPGGVAFRDLGTGRLLTYLQLGTMCESVGNPAVDWDVEEAPIVQAADSLVVTDSWDFICVDLDRRTIRWQKRILDIDRGGADAQNYRFWANGQTLVVLKPDYDSLGFEGVSLQNGRTLWHLNEAKTPGALFNCVIGPKTVCGLHYYRDDAATVRVMAYNLADGKRLYTQIHRGYKKPQTWLSGPLHGRRCVVQVSDEQVRALLVVDADSGKVLDKVTGKGFGLWGGYGEISFAVLGSNVMLLSDKDLIVARPAGP